MFIWFIVTLLLGFTGGYIGHKIKIPAGAMVLSMVFVGTFQVVFGKGYLYDFIKPCLQVASGVLIGTKINREALIKMKSLWKPAFILIVFMGLYNIGTAYLISSFSEIDFLTALFASAPGGMTDLTILSADYHVNTPIIAILHLVRVLLILIVIPVLVARLKPEHQKDTMIHSKKETKFSTKDLFLAFLCSFVLGFFFKQIGISSGIMIGSMLASAVYSLSVNSFVYPRQLVFVLKCIAGTFTGLRLTKEVVMMLPRLWLPICLLFIGVFVFIFLSSFFMRYYTKMTKVTAMLSTCPGALSDMVLLSEELGGDSACVAALQTLRMFSVVMMVPIFIGFFA